jgi:hypothetical protein
MRKLDNYFRGVKVFFFLISFLFYSGQGIARTLNFTGLRDLIINYGELSPKFNPEITSYTLILPDKILVNELKFTAMSDGGEIRINNQNVHSGKPWFSIDQKLNKVKIEVFNSQKLEKIYYIFISRLIPRLFVSDSFRLKNVFISLDFSKRPKWMDKNGYVYSTSGDTIYKSVNKGVDWFPIHVVPDSLKGGSFDRSALIAANDNRIIYCSKGYVMVSDENQNNFSAKYTFLRQSIPRFHLGYSANDSIILLGTYENYSDTAEVILSTNYGNSWKRIFFMKKPYDGYVFHIHDVQYDSFSKQIIIVTGDSKNCQIYCSKDLGNSWYTLFKNSLAARIHQTSQILCFPHGIVLGSDVPYDGIMYVPRNTDDQDVLNDDKVFESDNFVRMDNVRDLKRFAVKEWNTKKDNRTYSLLPWYHCIFSSQNVSNDYSRLWLTYNGIEWYELYKWQTLTSGLYGFTNIIGPDPADKQNTVFSNFHGAGILTAQIQFPEHLESVHLFIPENQKHDVNEAVFEWSKINYAYDYKIQISLNSFFSDIVAEDSMIQGVNYFCDKLSDYTKYYWRVKAVGIDGEGSWSDVHEFNTQKLYVPVSDFSYDPILYQNFPNPFKSSTEVYYYIPETSRIKLTVYNTSGKSVFETNAEVVEAGVFATDISLDKASNIKSEIFFVALDVCPVNNNKVSKKVIKILMVN